MRTALIFIVIISSFVAGILIIATGDIKLGCVWLVAGGAWSLGLK